MSWREKAAPIIARVLRETSGKDDKDVRAALREAYPFGSRQYHPYKVWCDEIARQQGRKPKLGTRKPTSGTRPNADPNQIDLWGER